MRHSPAVAVLLGHVRPCTFPRSFRPLRDLLASPLLIGFCNGSSSLRLVGRRGNISLVKRGRGCAYFFREVRMGRFVKDGETAEIAWKLFEQTGSLSYYMLYKQLKK